MIDHKVKIYPSKIKLSKKKPTCMENSGNSK